MPGRLEFHKLSLKKGRCCHISNIPQWRLTSCIRCIRWCEVSLNFNIENFPCSMDPPTHSSCKSKAMWQVFLDIIGHAFSVMIFFILNKCFNKKTHISSSECYSSAPHPSATQLLISFLNNMLILKVFHLQLYFCLLARPSTLNDKYSGSLLKGSACWNEPESD